MAGEWADETRYSTDYPVISKTETTTVKGKEITTTTVVKGKKAEAGNIVSFGQASTIQDDAHVGIYLGYHIYISATGNSTYGQKGVVIKKLGNSNKIIYRNTNK